jgi:tRNA (mo5U34)-methyltransferase
MPRPVASLADAVNDLAWYHTIQLPDGIVTPGFYDTLKGSERVRLPVSLEGKRCLDIGTCDGFWAFELERRGAAEVVGIDLADPSDRDWPGAQEPATADGSRSKQAFAVAKEALESRVERVDLSIYDVSTERLGAFDFVFIGNLLLHLRDPVGALMAVRSVVAGELFSVDVVSLAATVASPRTPAAVLSRRTVPYWWIPNVAAFRQYFVKSGFELIESSRPFFIPFGEGFHRRPALGELLRSPSKAFFWGVTHRLGATTASVRARPVASDAGRVS